MEGNGTMKPYLAEKEEVLTEIGASMQGLTDAEADYVASTMADIIRRAVRR